MSLSAVIKFGYTIVIVTFVLMIWASLSRALELHLDFSETPPCIFNPLCTCTKPVGDLGIVQCKNVPLFRIPERINGSKVFMLHMENNGIMDLDPYFFQSTGLYGLVINNNPLQDIPDDALLGLEKSLCELVLRNNQLTTIPSKSFRYMQKLKTLDLTGNEITDLAGDSWKGLENSLHVLILADNSIANLPPDAFSGLPLLETLDLHGNHLQSIDPTVFRDGMLKLNKLLLQDNLLTSIPYEEISPLKQLRYLDLSRNIIRQVQPDVELQNVKLSLNTLRLEYNAIEELVPMSFKYFSIVNTTVLDGNPLDVIKEDAFQQARIKTLSLRYCGLTEISPAAFAGLENSLQNLDLSSNNLTILPRSLFHQFDSLRTLNLKENKVDSIAPSESFNGFQFTLYHLDLSGKTNGAVSLQDVRRMRSLRSLSVSKLIHKSLDEEDFSEYGVELESLSITGSSIMKINKNAFHNVRTIKTLDLSENNIESFDNDAFRDLGHMLITLKLSNGLADSVTYFPSVLSSLYNLQNLDLSNNRIKNIPDTALLSLLNIKRLELQDNVIEDFYKGTLQGEQHKSLEAIILSMNSLRKIHQHTFVELETLKEVSIEDNLIEHIERRSFLNLISLNRINLRGNKVSYISDEAFQNLPALTELLLSVINSLELIACSSCPKVTYLACQKSMKDSNIYASVARLDLSFNQLGTFDFTMFDQVGTLSSLKVNASYNKIKKCSDVMSYSDGRDSGYGSIVNIKVLDLSHNNITYIGDFYFRHVASSLTHLHLEHNQLKNVTKSMFNSMPQLMYLDLSHNQIHHLQPSTFREVQQLQILSLKHNYLLDIPPEFFKRLSMLKIVELNKNMLRSLPDNLFTERGLERLDLSYNELSRIPTNALSNGASATLVNWDLSGNIIPAIASSDLAQRFRTEDFFERQMFDADWQEDDYPGDQNSYVYHSVQRPNSKVIHQRTQSQHKVLFKSLSWLDLSENKLVRIEGNSFSSLPKLRWLDLSNNKDLVLEKGSGIFRGLERRLINLGLRNISMSILPPLPLARLKSLDLSHNDLPSIPSDSATNLTQLRKLDLSYNDLTTVPIVTHTFSELKWLSLTGNPISTLTNTSLYGVSGKLEYLDVTRLQLKSMERGVFAKMCALRTLKVTAYVKIRDFNIPKLISYNTGLKNLVIEVLNENINLGQEMSGPLPSKLNNLTITGRSLTYLSDSILYGMHSAELRLTLYNTSVNKIDQALFWHAGRLRNITLDLRNNDLTTVANPSTGEWPGIPNTVFLNDIFLTNNPLVCDCGLGWIEVWDRKRRQYFCGDVIGNQCMSSRDDLRSSKCSDNENRTLIDMFQNELECGWNSVESLFIPKLYCIIGIAIVTMLYI